VNMEELDPTDVEILKLLQRDASRTHKEIAFKLHKSVATVHERTRRLKEKGYIKRVVAVLDGRKIGAGLIAFSRNKLATLPNISPVQSYFVLSEVKSETAFPLQARPERHKPPLT
jgi:Lrp/AsnC family leucine-responsive transcriptional regulator